MRAKVFLFLICFLFLVTRLVKISEIPPSVYWDEASIGYNAYAVSLDGKDEWGEFLPLHFRAFGEFKLPVYIYSVVPFVKLFGLNAIAVRLPSVIYSLATILLVYLLVKRIFKDEVAALFSALFLTVTPWLFIFSRTGYEAAAGLMFFLLGLYLFLLSLQQQKYFLLSTLAFVISIYSYNSFRLLSPVFFLILSAIFLLNSGKEFKKRFICVVGCLFFVLISFVPIYRLYKYDSGAFRLSVVGLSGTLLVKSENFARNYASHFSPGFLFSYGDSNPRSQMPGWGQIYCWSLPFLILGLVKIVRAKSIKGYFLLFILLLSPVPAALTKESPHALRSILMLPCLAVISSFGLSFLLKLFPKRRAFTVFVTVVVYLLFFESYLTAFFTEYTEKYSEEWQYSYEQIFLGNKGAIGEGEELIVSDKYGQPYIFALFYLKIDPDVFRQTVKYNPPDKWGFSTVASFNGFEFKP